MSEEEENEAHAVDEDTDVLHKSGERLGPQVRGGEGGLVVGHAIHDHDEVTDNDGEQTEGGNGHQQPNESRQTNIRGILQKTQGNAHDGEDHLRHETAVSSRSAREGNVAEEIGHGNLPSME